MANMSQVKNEMPVQDPEVRITNFSEVALGYTPEQAIDEATRCLNCKRRPCVGGCPVAINIPDFIQKIVVGEFEEAYQIISQSSALPAVCGRFAHRKANVNVFAFAELAVKRLRSVGWNVLSPIGTEFM